MKTTNYLLIIIFLSLSISCSKTNDEPRTPRRISLDEKSAQLVTAENKFGLDLFQRIYESETEAENIMVSPLSVSLALAMTYNGANNETKTAMEKAIKVYGLTSNDINKSYNSLVTALKSLDPKVVLEIANAIFYRNTFEVEDNFIKTNKTYYNSEIKALDFNSTAAKEEINNWAKVKTHDKIDKIIDGINPNDVMFLLNAVYFNGIWKSKFDEKATTVLPFYTNKTTSTEVAMMTKTDTVPYFTNNTFSAIQLAYGSGNYNMQIFLPHKNNSVENIVNSLTEEKWQDWMAGFTNKTKVDIKIPQLKYAYEVKLNNILSDMGMGIAFSKGADFTGINKAGNLFINYVKHKTFIDVNENGTEAAAVTVVGIVYTSVSPNAQFNADRPFFYTITEKDTGAILFMGTVKKPEYKK